ncbi:TetR/AcrR family transcriptional regulator [Streptomyces sp. NPDC002643]
MGTRAEEPTPTARRERNPRGQGDRLRDDVIAALARIVSDDDRMRPVSVSLRELAREAGVTAPAIYRHFAGVEEVSRAVALDGFARLVSAMDDADENAADRSAVDRLIDQAHVYCRFAVEHRGHFRLMFAAESTVIGTTADSASALGELLERWRRAVSWLQEDGVAVGDVDMAAMYVWTAMHGRLALDPLISSVWGTSDIRRFVELMVHEIVSVGRR